MITKNKILSILLILFLMGCTADTKNKTQVSKSQKTTEEASITTDNSLKDWWDYKYSSTPKYDDNEYLKDFDLDTLLKYYRILSIEFFNSKGSTRSSLVEKNLAEKCNINYMFFTSLNDYMGLKYYKYLGYFVKEYFANNEIGIFPDYYAPVGSTAYIGNHTFNCQIIVNKCKDDEDIEESINEKLNYLKKNLPQIIDGFRIFSVKYNCEETGISDSLGIGYIWVRKGDVLMKMDEDTGTYANELPEYTIHWNQDSWNNKQKLINDYKIK